MPRGLAQPRLKPSVEGNECRACARKRRWCVVTAVLWWIDEDVVLKRHPRRRHSYPQKRSGSVKTEVPAERFNVGRSDPRIALMSSIVHVRQACKFRKCEPGSLSPYTIVLLFRRRAKKHIEGGNLTIAAMAAQWRQDLLENVVPFWERVSIDLDVSKYA